MKSLSTHTRLLIFFIILFCVYIAISFAHHSIKKPLPPPPPIPEVLYTGKIYNMFFHSLIVYPKQAFKSSEARGYRDYMVTQYEFEKILIKLYEDNFILIDPHLLYTLNENGTITPKPLYLPTGKKPLVLSQDDVNYYKRQQGNGFANKLVLDVNGNVATEITTPEGKTIVTRDGDLVPIVDDFVASHPDFSYRGMKGIIAETGYEGVLGYRTNDINSPSHFIDLIKVREVVQRLKGTGWLFASHSYSHGFLFLKDTITVNGVAYDSLQWKKEVEPIVGKTDIFIGPFGQIFQPNDPRRQYLIDQGYKIIMGVGMDLYLKYFPNHLIMDRANIDGIRLIKTPHLLMEYFNPTDVIDPERGN